MKIIKVHGFCNTNTPSLFEKNMGIKNNSQRLDHKSIKDTTYIYIKVTPTKQNEPSKNLIQYIDFNLQFGIINIYSITIYQFSNWIKTLI